MHYKCHYYKLVHLRITNFKSTVANIYLFAHERLVTEELKLVIELVVTQGCGELGRLPQTPRPEVADDLRCVMCGRSSG